MSTDPNAAPVETSGADTAAPAAAAPAAAPAAAAPAATIEALRLFVHEVQALWTGEVKSELYLVGWMQPVGKEREGFISEVRPGLKRSGPAWTFQGSGFLAASVAAPDGDVRFGLKVMESDERLRDAGGATAAAGALPAALAGAPLPQAALVAGGVKATAELLGLVFKNNKDDVLATIEGTLHVAGGKVNVTIGERKVEQTPSVRVVWSIS
jgi:hypothetical protein